MEELCQEGRTTVAPDAITYVTVMNAWAASKSPDGPRRAEEILDEMNERYLDGEDEMRPTPRSIKAVIDAWIKTNDPSAMDRAEAMLDKYEDFDEFQAPIQDETVQEIYKCILFGYSKNKDPRQAEEYLRNMVQMGIKPDCFCFDRIVEAYTQLNAPDSLERTFGVFEFMEECRKAGDMKPNERVYTSFIRALTKAKTRGLAKRANLILKKMESLYEQGNTGIKPTTFTYNAVLNACAESISTEDSEPLEAFSVAIGIFNDLRNSSSEGPDHVTFGNMLRCAALLPEGEQRDAVLSSIFSLGCKRGLVNSYVVRDLQYASSEELWRSLLKWPVGEVDCDQLPAAWMTQFERKAKPDRPASGRGRPAGRKFSKRY
jgi:pentatricopeptide repeat protein